MCSAGQPRQVDIHAVALFFFAQLYLRQAQRPDAMDIWPSQASQDEKAFNSQLMPAHQQGQTQPHQPHHSPLQNGGQPGQQEPVSPARSNSSRSSAGSQGSPGKSTVFRPLIGCTCDSCTYCMKRVKVQLRTANDLRDQLSGPRFTLATICIKRHLCSVLAFVRSDALTSLQHISSSHAATTWCVRSCSSTCTSTSSNCMVT